MTEDEMIRQHHRLNGHELEQTPGDSEGQGSLVCCSSPGCKELDTTQQLNNSNNNSFLLKGFPGGSAVKNSPAMQGMQVRSLGWKDPLE